MNVEFQQLYIVSTSLSKMITTLSAKCLVHTLQLAKFALQYLRYFTCFCFYFYVLTKTGVQDHLYVFLFLLLRTNKTGVQDHHNITQHPKLFMDKIGIKQFHLVCTFIILCLFSSWSECSKKSLGTVVILPLIHIGDL